MSGREPRGREVGRLGGGGEKLTRQREQYARQKQASVKRDIWKN